MAKRSRKISSGYEPDPNEELLRRFKHDFIADFRADERWRKESAEASEFYDGVQWTQEERRILEERGQPVVVINRIKQRFDSIFGIQEALRVDTKAYPRGEKEEEAEELSEFLRQIEDDNDFDNHEAEVFEDETIDGRGWYEMGKEWDGLRYCHFVRRAPNEDITPDRFGRKIDLSDHNRISKSVMTELEDAKKLFTDFEEKLETCVTAGYLEDKAFSGQPHKQIRPDQYKNQAPGFSPDDYNDFVDRNRRRIRLITMHYRTKEVETLFFHAKLDNPIDATALSEKEIKTLQESYPQGEIITQWKKKLNVATFCWNALLEHKKDIRPHDETAKYPYVLSPAFTERKTYLHYGLTRQLKDPQREVNKRRSKLIHVMNTNQVRFTVGAFDDPQAARREFVKPDGFIQQNPGFEVIVDKNLDVAQSHFLMLQTATQEIDTAASGREIEGRSSSGDSGRAFQLRQQQATQSLRKLFANLRTARRRVAEYFVDEYLKENPGLDVTKYDIVVDEAPESLNLNSETFEQLISLANSSPQIAQVLPVDMLIKVSPLAASVKSEFLDRIKQQQAAMAAQMAGMPGQGGAPPAAMQQ